MNDLLVVRIERERLADLQVLAEETGGTVSELARTAITELIDAPRTKARDAIEKGRDVKAVAVEMRAINARLAELEGRLTRTTQVFGRRN